MNTPPSQLPLPVRSELGSTEIAPDGMRVVPLSRGAMLSTATFALAPRTIGHAVKHRTVEEVWYVTSGEALLWRSRDGIESTQSLVPGMSVTIPVDTCFQLNVEGEASFEVIGATAPPWPGDLEARRVNGKWRPTVPSIDVPIVGEVRAAQVSDCQTLSELAVRSKAWWGYSESFLKVCEQELTVKPASIGHVFVVDVGGVPAGFHATELESERTAELTFMFTEPAFIGCGVGRLLFTHAAEHARSLHCDRLIIAADPGAEGFYEAMGARVIGDCASDSVTGRRLPLLQLDL